VLPARGAKSSGVTMDGGDGDRDRRVIKSVEIVRRFTTKHARAILRVTMRSNEDPEEEFDATIELNDGSTTSTTWSTRLTGVSE